jgi:hypothetical protein
LVQFCFLNNNIHARQRSSLGRVIENETDTLVRFRSSNFGEMRYQVCVRALPHPPIRVEKLKSHLGILSNQVVFLSNPFPRRAEFILLSKDARHFSVYPSPTESFDPEHVMLSCFVPPQTQNYPIFIHYNPSQLGQEVESTITATSRNCGELVFKVSGVCSTQETINLPLSILYLSPEPSQQYHISWINPFSDRTVSITAELAEASSNENVSLLTMHVLSVQPRQAAIIGLSCRTHSKTVIRKTLLIRTASDQGDTALTWRVPVVLTHEWILVPKRDAPVQLVRQNTTIFSSRRSLVSANGVASTSMRSLAGPEPTTAMNISTNRLTGSSNRSLNNAASTSQMALNSNTSPTQRHRNSVNSTFGLPVTFDQLRMAEMSFTIPAQQAAPNTQLSMTTIQCHIRTKDFLPVPDVRIELVQVKDSSRGWSVKTHLGLLTDASDRKPVDSWLIVEDGTTRQRWRMPVVI